MPIDAETRLARLEAQAFASSQDQYIGVPQDDILPSAIKLTATAGPDGALITVSWDNWSPLVETYEIWIKAADEQQVLRTTSEFSPAFFTLGVDAATPYTVTVRPRAGDRSVGLDFAPSETILVPPPAIDGDDIADGSIGDSHFDRVSANQIAIVDADILNLSANKLTAGTIDAAIITVTNIDASNINTGTLNASIVNVTNINAGNINTGTLNAAIVNVININAANINVGTLNGINITAGTYSLSVGSNLMQINGTNGIYQQNTTSLLNVRILNGGLTGRYSSTTGWSLSAIQASGNVSGVLSMSYNSANKVTLNSQLGYGNLNLFGASGSSDVLLRANVAADDHTSLQINNTSGSARVAAGVDNAGADGVVEILASSGRNLVAQNGQLISTVSGSNRFILGQISNDGYLQIYRSGSLSAYMQTTSGFGDFGVVDNASGNTVAQLAGIATRGGRLQIRNLSFGARVEASIDGSDVGQILINGTKVIGAQGVTIGNPSGGATVDSEARLAINAIINRLQAHGLIA